MFDSAEAQPVADAVESVCSCIACVLALSERVIEYRVDEAPLVAPAVCAQVCGPVIGMSHLWATQVRHWLNPWAMANEPGEFRAGFGEVPGELGEVR